MSTSDTLRILHLTDTHLYGDGSLHYGMVDTFAALRRVLDFAMDLEAVDLIVVSGDLSEDGSEASYRVLRDLIDPWAAARGAVVVYAMGNHDLRTNFEKVLGERDSVTTVHGFRILCLDSSVPGAGHGELSTEQLGWLRTQLGEAAPNGAIVVLHHPPVPASTDLLKALELRNPAELLMVCSMASVRLILAGHYHHIVATVEAGIQVIVAPAIANTSDVLGPRSTERAMVGAGFAFIQVPPVGAPRTVFVSVPGPDDGTEIFNLDATEVQRIIRTAGVSR